MGLSIYAKIDADSVGSADLEDYAAFVRQELATWYPDAQITIETTTRESGCLPCVITDATAEEESDIRAIYDNVWNIYCAR